MADVTIPLPDADPAIMALAAQQVYPQVPVEFADEENPTPAECEQALAEWAENALEELVTAMDAAAAAEEARQAAIARAAERKAAKKAAKQ